MSPAMQARLLRVLQEGEIRRVGGDRTTHVDVRVIAATHRDLQREVEAGRFREDLLYRLQVLLIELPPLRERIGDLPLIVEHLLEKIGRVRGRPSPRLGARALELLARYTWPGNVRQLENTLQRLALLATDGEIDVERILTDKALNRMFAGEPPPLEAPTFSLSENEREQIRASLEATAGNRVRAAQLLGISRATIFRKIKEHGLG
jgi:DNA-binding NtrC family response regulator